MAMSRSRDYIDGLPVEIAERIMRKRRRKKKRGLVGFWRSNLEYYQRMAKAFPNEPVWKKAVADTEKLLEEAREK